MDMTEPHAAAAVPKFIRGIVAEVVACCDPDEVLLFGSFAKGTAGPNSDVDLLVVGPDFCQRRRHALTSELGCLFGQFIVPVQAVLRTPVEVAVAETEDPYSFLSSILKHAIQVYHRDRRRHSGEELA